MNRCSARLARGASRRIHRRLRRKRSVGALFDAEDDRRLTLRASRNRPLLRRWKMQCQCRRGETRPPKHRETMAHVRTTEKTPTWRVDVTSACSTPRSTGVGFFWAASAAEVVPSASCPTVASAVESAKDGTLIQIQPGHLDCLVRKAGVEACPSCELIYCIRDSSHTHTHIHTFF